MKTSWSKSESLNVGDTRTVNMQRDFEVPGSYTVQFGIQNDDPTGQIVRAQAEIIWSVDGNSVRRVVDAINGTSVSGTAEGVQVYVRDQSRAFGVGTSPYLVSIQVVQGTRPSVQQPPYLTDANISHIFNAGANSLDITVPQNSGVISLYAAVGPQVVGNPIAAYDVLVQQRSTTGFVLKTYDPRDFEWVPLSSGADIIRIAQAAGAPATRWTLTFGIDG